MRPQTQNFAPDARGLKPTVVAERLRSVPLGSIVTNAGTQVRERIGQETVARYKEALLGGSHFPPLVVFHDGSRYFLADGFHRVRAAREAGMTEFNAHVRQGTRSDALRFALSANVSHGLARSCRDKRRSVQLALKEWPNLSSREYGRICAVSHSFVEGYREQLATVYSCGARAAASRRKGADGKERRLPSPRGQGRGDAGRKKGVHPHSGESSGEFSYEEWHLMIEDWLSNLLRRHGFTESEFGKARLAIALWLEHAPARWNEPEPVGVGQHVMDSYSPDHLHAQTETKNERTPK